VEEREELAMAPATDMLTAQAVAAGNTVPIPGTDGLRLGELLRRTHRCAQQERLPVFAGYVAYRTLFACFPCLFTLFWLVEAVGGQQAVQGVVGLCSTVLPAAAAQAVQQQFRGTTGDQASGALTAGAVLAGLVALWAVMLMMSALMEAFTSMYAVPEDRPLWQRTLVALALGWGVSILLVGAGVAPVW
jgi:uncharacterized BrkB/YihY/UPF0761 family membrane protein